MDAKQRGGRGRIWAAAAVALGMAISGASVWQASQAAFSAQTGVNGNTFSVGSVTITNDRSGAVIFTGGTTNMAPGASDSKCVRVTYQGTLASEVRMYASAYSDTGLAQYLHLTIEEGDGGTFADCSAFTRTAYLVNDQLAADVFDPLGVPAHRDYASGLGGAWKPSSNPSYKTYRVTYSLPSSTTGGPGSGLVITLTWEANSL
jgi:hypothetical protein